MSFALATQGDGKKKKLSPKQVQALALLVAGHTHEGVAGVVEIPITTLQSWLQNPLFNDEYRLAMERYRMILEGRLNSIAQKASNKINEFLDSTNPEIRLEAAKIAINAAVRANNRYKEVQVQGLIQPQPLVVFPVGTQLPWASKAPLPELPEAPSDIIDVDSEDVTGDSDE